MFLSARCEALLGSQPGREGYQAADAQFAQALAAVGRQGDVEPRDMLDAIVCGAMISFGLERPETALSQIGNVLDGASRHPEGTGVEAWTAVRVVQGELIKGIEHLSGGRNKGTALTSLQAYLWRLLTVSTMPPTHIDPCSLMFRTLSPNQR